MPQLGKRLKLEIEPRPILPSLSPVSRKGMAVEPFVITLLFLCSAAERLVG
jgi:hypothetical protein